MRNRRVDENRIKQAAFQLLEDSLHNVISETKK